MSKSEQEALRSLDEVARALGFSFNPDPTIIPNALSHRTAVMCNAIERLKRGEGYPHRQFHAENLFQPMNSGDTSR